MVRLDNFSQRHPGLHRQRRWGLSSSHSDALRFLVLHLHSPINNTRTDSRQIAGGERKNGRFL